MHYIALLEREDDNLIVTFPGCPGCITEAYDEEEVLEIAQDALETWLESHLESRILPPRPGPIRSKPGEELLRVPVSPRLAAILQLRWARHDAQLSQAQLAKRIGVSQQQIAQLESPDANPTLATLARVAEGLGARIEVNVRPSPELQPA